MSENANNKQIHLIKKSIYQKIEILLQLIVQKLLHDFQARFRIKRGRYIWLIDIVVGINNLRAWKSIIYSIGKTFR